ncbi:tetratricopeptide repeat-containing sensor histidine kinase [Parabacteroides johnsonii]|uniref:tetratricopeptide repeat-containing sensor histidine kinase n=1 Tax=Parabacteroides johnsonii TaxID=387661 RepID=UPI00266C2FB0|nr:histidine kinase [Parabacteroides johnsonii]
MNLLKIFLIGFIVLGLSNSCSCRLSKEPDGEVLLTDSILAIYQDSMAEAPQKVLDVFFEKRLHMQDSLCFYLLLSYESKCYYYLNRMEDAFRTNKEVIRYCTDHASFDRSRVLLAEAFNNQGVYWQELGERDSAIRVLKSSVDILQTVRNRSILTSVYINLADCHLQKGDYPHCGFYYRKALLVADSLGLGYRDHFAIYSGLAKLYLELENFPEANEYFVKAEQIGNSCTPYERYFFSNTRGNYYYNTKEYEKALDWFRKADRITEAFPQPLYKAIVRGNLGEIFILIRQPDSARFYLDDARRLFGKAYEQPSFRYYMDGLYASLALLENDLSQAERLLSSAHDLNQVNPLYTYYNNRRMEELYYKKKDYRKAYEFKDKADMLNDSLRNVKVRNSLAEIDFRYRQDTTLLKMDIQLINARDEMSRWKTIAYYCVLLLLLSLSASLCWILYRRRKHEKQYWIQMTTMNRLRMAVVRNRISPHFIFNALNIILPTFRQYDGLAYPIRLLIKVLRGNLFFSEQIAVSLKDEIQLVKEYLQLRLLGNPDRIRIIWELPPEIPDAWKIPSMSVQIPVENAVKYAFDPENEEACIHIRIVKKQGSLFIAIEDNGIGLTADMQNRQEEQGTGYGLKILRQTIDILNSRNKNKMNFIIQDRNLLEPGGHGTLVSLVVPLDYTFDL